MTIKSRISKPGTGASVAAGRDTVRFGDVVVTVRKPDKAERQKNVDSSSEALARMNSRIMRPGVRLYPKKDVPLFWADEHDPSVLIRELNGVVQRRLLKDGQFEPLDGVRLTASD